MRNGYAKPPSPRRGACAPAASPTPGLHTTRLALGYHDAWNHRPFGRSSGIPNGRSREQAGGTAVSRGWRRRRGHEGQRHRAVHEPAVDRQVRDPRPLGVHRGGAARDRRYGKGNGGDKGASQTPAATRHRRHLNHPGAARSVRVPGYLAPDLALRNGPMRVNAQADRRRQERPRHGRVDDPGVPHIMDARAPGESVGRPAARVVVFRDRPDSHDDQHAERKYRGVNPVTAPPLDLLDRLLAGVLLSVRGACRDVLTGNRDLRLSLSCATRPMLAP